jgi:hypothetical protein
MRIHKVLLGALVVATTAAAPSAFADVSLNIEIGVPPPAPLVEVAPAPRVGYVWTAGYWGWNGYRWAWVPGRWIVARPGYHWQHEHWAHVGDHWRFVQGDWVRDKREIRRDRDRHEDRDRDWRG